MDAAVEIPSTSTQDTTAPTERRRPPRNRQRNAPRAADSATEPRQNEVHNHQQRPSRPPRGGAGSQVRSSPATGAESKKRDTRPRNPPKPRNTGPTAGEPTNNEAGGQSSSAAPRRGAKFGGGLTEPGSTPASQPSNRYRKKAAPTEPLGDDLTSRLIHDLRTAPYPDCPICFSSIHPNQRTWSCSPSIPIIRPPDDEGLEQQYCWTTFHVKCIGEWASTNVKAITDAWRARGVDDKRGDWRCPGCQAKREIVPSGYWCFCNSTSEPKHPRLATPHSCANPCSRARESGCGHPCPLECHPGPCPPCQVTTRLQCYCPQKKIIAFRCGVDKGRARNLSCGSVCGRKLGCGNHVCEEVCHDGPCAKCPEREEVKCLCGSSTKEVDCGEGEGVQCLDENGTSWTGRYECQLDCQISFDCGTHQCEKPCHPPHPPKLCPLSPSLITTCPCGAHPISGPTTAPLPTTTPTTFPARSSCSSRIPTCASPCSKPLSGCDHACVARCHTGPCPPCGVLISRPCRCGNTTRGVPCASLRNSAEILCDKPCPTLRACGRHQCHRLCCPLAALASAAKKGKKRALASQDVGVGEERGGLHECDLVCAKPLTCGLHKCEERDHKGPCPPCLRSSFEEMICYCGRTVLEPPIPCGTQMRCTRPCSRPALPCGHRSPHMCHEDPTPCPPCPHLASKQCACGKKLVNNVKCSLETEKVSCGAVCGKLMDCGVHQCDRLCHGDQCGPCKAPCGKPRKLCLPVGNHPCTRPCHVPASCLEDESCAALVTLSCSCGRLRQSVYCGRCTSAQTGHQQAALKCNNDCALALRGARLAEALGIMVEAREKTKMVTYHPDLLAVARANGIFLTKVEKALDEFVTSQKKTQVLPHMPPDRREFVRGLAAVYRMDTQIIDQEPNRSVRLLRRLDTRVPNPLLSATITASTPTPPSLGKLTDLRTASTLAWRAGPAISAPEPSASGWRSRMVSATPSSMVNPAISAPKPSASVWKSRTVSATLSSMVNPQQSSRPIASAVAARVSNSTPPLPVQRDDAPVTPTVVPDSWEEDYL